MIQVLSSDAALNLPASEIPASAKRLQGQPTTVLGSAGNDIDNDNAYESDDELYMPYAKQKTKRRKLQGSEGLGGGGGSGGDIGVGNAAPIQGSSQTTQGISYVYSFFLFRSLIMIISHH